MGGKKYLVRLKACGQTIHALSLTISSRYLKSMLDGRFNHGAGANATGTNSDALGIAAVGGDSDCLQVRQPTTTGLIVGMADVISGGGLLAAQITHS